MEKTSHGKWYGDACGAAFGLELLGERWALMIMRELMFGGRRFKALRDGLPGVSAKVLTERLHGLEEEGIVRRTSVGSIQRYELTAWGYHADDVLLALCRWALASPDHDHTLFLSPAAMMMSLRALFDSALADGVALAGAIQMGEDAFVVSVADARLSVARGTADRADFTITAPGADAIKCLIYGKAPPALLAESGLSITGDCEAASRFVRLFRFPVKEPARVTA